MIINNIKIYDTYAEAFPMKYSRLIVTADSYKWALNAVNSFIGFATSVIACGCEAGLESKLSRKQTPDNRPGYSVLIFSMSSTELAKQILNRAGQCIMTSPGSALYSGNKSEKKINLGHALRYFGDGFQISKIIKGNRYWRIPVMDGEFLCQDYAYESKGIGGGNFIILGKCAKSVLRASEIAVKAMNKIANIILPFPGGIVRSGSKVGSKYKKLIASTNFEYCPYLKGVVKSKIPEKVNSVLEIVIDGISEEDIKVAIKVGVSEILKYGGKLGIFGVSAGNYGGKLGPFLFNLRKILR